ncbi:RING finger protein [Dirofilaria immitis]
MTCPSANCYSQIRNTLSDSLPLVINYCDNMMCPKKLSQFESNRLNACQHELCTTCLEESLQRQPPACIVENCNQIISELDEAFFCDNCGKQMIDSKKLIVTDCCKCHLCEQCVENRINMNLLNKETMICVDGKCLSKKKKTENEEMEVKCKVKDGCKGIALNGFPSNSECNHDVCIQCLTDMISDCETTGLAPMCPEASCHQYYTIESVNALRMLFPQKIEFFQRFDLNERKIEFLCKDDSITFVDFSSEFDFASRQMTIRVRGDSEEESEKILIYDKQGTIGDFIREIRRILQILPYEKIYGYFIKHEDEIKDENATGREIATDAISLAKCISELHLTSASIVQIDTADY